MPRRGPFLVKLADQERAVLDGRARQYTSAYREVIRAKIVLLAAEGVGNDVLASRLHLPRQVVSKWRKRFCLWRLPGLAAEPRGGRPPRLPPRKWSARSRLWPVSSRRATGCRSRGGRGGSSSAKGSEGLRESLWLQGMMAGMPAACFCIQAFSETDLTLDLKKMGVPTLFLHGDDDQIVPIADSAMLAVKLVKNGTLKVYPGAPHGLCTTLKDQVNADLLAFCKG